MPRLAQVVKPAARKGPGYKPPVKGEIGPIPPEVVFDGAGRKSIYDELLKRLLDVPGDQGLCFAETRCRTTVLARAKKLGLRILTAECEGRLWVKLAGVAKQALVQTSARPLAPAEACLQILREMPRTGAEVHDHMERCLAGCSRAASDAVLEKLRKDGLAVKRDDLKWYLINRKG